MNVIPSARRNLRQLKRGFLLFCAASFVVGCETAPFDKIVKTSQTGASATSDFRALLQAQSKTSNRVAEMDVFDATYQSCPNPSITPPCEEIGPNANISKNLATYRKHLESRTVALKHLEEAYINFGKDAETDAGEAFSQSLNGLYDESKSLATAIGQTIPDSGATTLILTALDELGQAIAKYRQTKRLKDANVVLGNATNVLSLALEAEEEAHTTFYNLLSARQNRIRDDFIDAKVLDNTERLTKLAALAGLELSSEEAAAALDNPRIRNALAAAERERTKSQKDVEHPVKKAVEVLRAMSKMHKEIDDYRESDFDRVLRLAEEAQRLSDVFGSNEDDTSDETIENPSL